MAPVKTVVARRAKACKQIATLLSRFSDRHPPPPRSLSARQQPTRDFAEGRGPRAAIPCAALRVALPVRAERGGGGAALPSEHNESRDGGGRTGLARSVAKESGLLLTRETFLLRAGRGGVGECGEGGAERGSSGPGGRGQGFEPGPATALTNSLPLDSSAFPSALPLPCTRRPREKRNSRQTLVSDNSIPLQLQPRARLSLLCPVQP